MIKKYLGTIFTIFFLVLFFLYFIRNREDFYSLKDVNILYLILIAFLQVFMILINGIFIKVILIAFKKEIAVFESFYISVLTTIGNYFTPFRGGAGIRAVYLKKTHNFSYSYFISTLYGNYLVVFLLSALTGLIGTIIIYLDTGIYSITLYTFLIGVFLGSLILTIIKLPNKFPRNVAFNKFLKKLLDIIRSIAQGWNFISSNKKLLIKLILLTFFNFALMFLITYIEFISIGITLSFSSTLVYSSLSSITLLVSVTPGSIGIRESIFIFFSEILGITNSEILQAAVIDRGVLFFLLFILFIFSKIFNSKGKSKLQMSDLE